LAEAALQLPGDTGTAEELSKSIAKDRCIRRKVVVFDPASQPLLSASPERHLSLFASLAVKEHATPIVCQDVLNAQGEKFGDASAGVVKQQEEQVIAPPRPRLIRSSQDGLMSARVEN
jgi:hypothetical protein